MGVLRTVGRGALLRCPHCGEGRIFRTLFQAHERCPRCEHDFERDPGDWTGGAELTMLISVAFGIGILFALMAWADLQWFEELVIVMVSVAAVMPFAYRHVKGFWLGVIRVWDGPDPQPNPLRDPEWFTALWDRETR